MKQSNNKEKAFSLIEGLVVISVIAIIAALVLQVTAFMGVGRYLHNIAYTLFFGGVGTAVFTSAVGSTIGAIKDHSAIKFPEGEREKLIEQLVLLQPALAKAIEEPYSCAPENVAWSKKIDTGQLQNLAVLLKELQSGNKFTNLKWNSLEYALYFHTPCKTVDAIKEECNKIRQRIKPETDKLGLPLKITFSLITVASFGTAAFFAPRITEHVFKNGKAERDRIEQKRKERHEHEHSKNPNHSAETDNIVTHRLAGNWAEIKRPNGPEPVSVKPESKDRSAA